tara:strand:+ start:89255 stop:89956 length:702 start_codon:yes stop_codon:yes gene_type:complete
MTNAYVFSFEGLDNCGKTTQIDLASSYLRDKGVEFIVECEPGATAFGGALRMLLKHPETTYRALNTILGGHADFKNLDLVEKKNSLSELFGFLAARAEFVDKIVAPAIASGTTVLTDRHVDSTTTYQGFGLFEGDEAMLSLINLSHNSIWAGRSNLKPVKTFVLDIPYEVMVARAGSNQADFIESRGKGFFDRVRAGYAFVEEQDSGRVVTIDGTLQPREVFGKIKKHLDDLF